MSIIVKNNYQISKSSGSIGGTPIRNETFNHIEVKHNNSVYNSYGVYTSINTDELILSLVYILIDGKMSPRVVKAAPHGHMEGHLYAFIFDGYAYNAEKRFELSNIPYVKFSDIKHSAEVFTPGLIS